MAGGAAGLFMLSEDSLKTAQPTAVDLRRYDPATRSFGAPLRLANGPASTPEPFAGGGLAENYDTGEIAAVWPQFSPSGSSLMRLYLSTSGGAHFSPAEYIATVGDGYPGMDNARLAIADGGSGFVTFQDANGLQVADLNPSAAQYGTLKSDGRVVDVPVTCPDPRQACRFSAKLTRGRGRALVLIAGGSLSVAAGATRTLALGLRSAGVALLGSGHGRFPADLTIVLHGSAGTSTITAGCTVRKR
jgi:hypothetical protein